MLGFYEVFLRFFCALLAGMIIGIEREYSNRPAGMRTHILVSIGACAVMMTSQVMFAQYHAFGANPDPARLPAQVVTGVGFLGAGTILHQGADVKGLTTAASLWAVACLGIATGAGYYAIAIAGTFFVYITLTLMEVFQHFLVGPMTRLRKGWVDTSDTAACLEALLGHAKKCNILVTDITVSHSENSLSRISFHLIIDGFHADQRCKRFFKDLTDTACVASFHIFSPEHADLFRDPEESASAEDPAVPASKG